MYKIPLMLLFFKVGQAVYSIIDPYSQYQF